MDKSVNYPLSICKYRSIYGTSIVISLPAKLKLGRLRPFINFAAVCERAVITIGRPIDGSLGTFAVVAPRRSLPKRAV